MKLTIMQSATEDITHELSCVDLVFRWQDWKSLNAGTHFKTEWKTNEEIAKEVYDFLINIH